VVESNLAGVVVKAVDGNDSLMGCCPIGEVSSGF
jgi:hypothetical protein